MNKLKFIITFVAGVAVGIIATAKYFDAKYSSIADDEIEDMRSRFERKNSKSTSQNDDNKKEPGSHLITEERLHHMANSPNKPYPHELIRNYAGEDQNTEPPEEDENTVVNSDGEVHNRRDVDFSNPSGPYLITEDEYEDDRNFDKDDLNYYEEDDVLVDSRGELVNDVMGTVGNALVNFVNDTEFLFVRNEKLGMDFCIQRTEGRWDYQ